MSMISIDTVSGALPAYLAEPSGAAQGGLILVHEIWGLNEHIQSVADRLSAEGYVTLAPDVLGTTDVSRQAALLQNDLFDAAKHNQAQARLHDLSAPLHDPAFVGATLNRLRAGLAYLRDRADVGEAVGAVGFSFGGTYAYQLAAEEPLLKAAVPFYGHAPLADDKLRWITCPILAFYGERDEPLMKQLPAVEEAMHEAGISFEARVYADAGRDFFDDTNPAAYEAESAHDAWQRLLDHLRRNLRS